MSLDPNPHGPNILFGLIVVLTAAIYAIWHFKIHPWLRRDRSAANLYSLDLERQKRKVERLIR